jgi:hexosaminidase
MSWRGIDGAVTAATRGHDTVLSPAPILYFDHRQASTPAEPPGRGRVVTLREVHDFDPAPAQLTQAQRRHILGLQANLWSEHIRTEDRMEHMAYPRALAVADLGWTGPGRRDWQDFVDRLLPQIDRMAPLGLDAAPSAFAVTASVKPDAAARRVEVTLSNQIGSDEIRYTLDGSTPTRSSKRYDRSLDLPVPTQLRAVAYHDGRALPYELVRSFDAASVRRKDDTALKTCTDNLTLALEDDAPIGGPRAVMLTDIMSPCWIFEDAPMDGVTAIEVTVGQLPFNFQIGRDVEKIRFDRPATPDGEIEVIAGGCEGTRIAVLPLAPAARSDALTTLRAAVAPRSGRENLCFTYTARGVDPMWAIDAVQLVTPDMKPAP